MATGKNKTNFSMLERRSCTRRPSCITPMLCRWCTLKVNSITSCSNLRKSAKSRDHSRTTTRARSNEAVRIVTVWVVRVSKWGMLAAKCCLGEECRLTCPWCMGDRWAAPSMLYRPVSTPSGVLRLLPHPKLLIMRRPKGKTRLKSVSWSRRSEPKTSFSRTRWPALWPAPVHAEATSKWRTRVWPASWKSASSS